MVNNDSDFESLVMLGALYLLVDQMEQQSTESSGNESRFTAPRFWGCMVVLLILVALIILL